MGKKILVVEDDPSSLRLTQYVLESKGYVVITAQNGLEGLKKAQTEEPELVVLDAMLPGIDGLEICYQLRAEPKTAGLPVLMLSAKARETDREAGLKVGVNAYLTKPAAPAEILGKVEELLAQGKQHPGEEGVERK